MPAACLQIRLLFSAPLNLGPGKIRLLQAIAATGSISAAARQQHISYRRAWLMADALNKACSRPLIDTVTGGKKGGGARLTALGEEVVRRYGSMLDAAEQVVAADAAWFQELAAAEAGASSDG